MNADEVRTALEPWRQKHSRPAWKPKTINEDGSRVASKFSGVPWLEQSEQWPRCGCCKSMMPFFLQLNSSELPQPAGQTNAGLIQLFYCTDCRSGWDAFSEVSLARFVPQQRLSNVSLEVDRGFAFPPRRIVSWEEFADYPHPAEHEMLGLYYTYDFTANPFTTRIECRDPEFIADGIIDDELAEKISISQSGDKLGGWPHWIQDAGYPLCQRCNRDTSLVFQVDSNDNIPFMFGDSGVGRIIQCKEHPDVVGFAWDCS